MNNLMTIETNYNSIMRHFDHHHQITWEFEWRNNLVPQTDFRLTYIILLQSINYHTLSTIHKFLKPQKRFFLFNKENDQRNTFPMRTLYCDQNQNIKIEKSISRDTVARESTN